MNFDNQKNLILPGLELSLVLSFLSLLLIASQALITGALAWLALAYYAALCWFAMRRFPAAFILLLWFIFARLTTMISGVAIETGGSMPEFMMEGHPTGAFARLAGIYTVGILGATMTLNYFMRYIPQFGESRKELPWANPVFALILILCAWAVVIGLKNGFPALENVDRILYWKKISSRFFYFFQGNRPIFALLLGLIYGATFGYQKRMALGIFLLVLVLSLLFAEKFTSICMIFFSFAAPAFLRDAAKLRSLAPRMILLGGLIAVVTIPAILLAYGAREDAGAALERFKTRATSQAEIWYVADQEQDQAFTLDFQALTHNLRAISSADPESFAQSPPYLGARYYMAGYLERGRYLHYLDRGVTLTMATEGYLLKMFGWLGMIPPYLLLIAVYCAYQAYLYFAIMTVNPVRVIFAGKLLVWANFSLNQGYFWFLVGVKALALIALIAFAEIVYAAYQKRQEESLGGAQRA